jgi:AhpD family alkylhydroperoxidase
MAKDYPQIARDLSAGIKGLRGDVPETLVGFSQLTREAMKDGAIDRKTEEFIAMALGVAARCDGYLAFHAEALVKLGASRQELAEVLGVAVQMGGGPSLMYAADAWQAFNQFEAARDRA